MTADRKKVWTVDRYVDRICCRDEKAVLKENSWPGRVHQTLFFASRGEAIAYMVVRAEERVTLAKKELAGDRRRLRKLQKLADDL